MSRVGKEFDNVELLVTVEATEDLVDSAAQRAATPGVLRVDRGSAGDGTSLLALFLVAAGDFCRDASWLDAERGDVRCIAAAKPVACRDPRNVNQSTRAFFPFTRLQKTLFFKRSSR